MKLPPSKIKLKYLGKSMYWKTKGKGEPCKRGERADVTGCIPASKEPSQPRKKKPITTGEQENETTKTPEIGQGVTEPGILQQPGGTSGTEHGGVGEHGGNAIYCLFLQ